MAKVAIYTHSALGTLLSVLGSILSVVGVACLFTGAIPVGIVLIVLGIFFILIAPAAAERSADKKWIRKIKKAGLEGQIAADPAFAASVLKTNPSKRAKKYILSLNPAAASFASAPAKPASAPRPANARYRTEKELYETFAVFFAPNSSFYSVPGSAEYNAYFNAINAAKTELLRYPQIFTDATGREPAELAELMKNKNPPYSNMYVCALIFCAGLYAAKHDAVFCVDFSEQIPNCIAVYLLLTAQRIPADRRVQLLDIGEGTNPEPLMRALGALQCCDPSWKCKITQY